jgi:hypothetical protein
MTFLELRNLVSYWVDDLQLAYFTATQVNSFLNNAQKELQKLLLNAGQNYYVKRYQTTTVINQADYVLMDDFEKLHRLELVISGTPPTEAVTPINSITINQQDLLLGNTATPCGYFIKKNRLVLFPTPNAAQTLRMYYSPRVADMTLDTDVPDAPAQYHEYIAVLAAHDCLMKDGRDPSTLQAKIKYYEEMLKNDAQERQVDGPRTIVDTGNSYTANGFYW